MLDKKEPFLLLVGDVSVFAAALWLAISLRQAGFADGAALVAYLTPFLIIFTLWILVFFVAGLYDKHRVWPHEKLLSTVARVQVVNAALAMAFFYLTVPHFGIAPKAILFLDVALSSAMVGAWRLVHLGFFSCKKKEPALLIGSGKDMRRLYADVNANPRIPIFFVTVVDLDRAHPAAHLADISKAVKAGAVTVVVADLKDSRIEPILSHLYNLIFADVAFVDLDQLYEDIYDRVPLEHLRHNWFLENISQSPKFTYDVFKRLLDVSVGLVVGVLSLAVYPFVMAAIKLDDGGPVFIAQVRVGKNGRRIVAHKFRTMARNETNLAKGGSNSLTRVGPFLRKTRLDELPQIWSVLAGSISLIGPRPELPSGVALYEKAIPYYDIRHLIKPGLSGWAQVMQENHPHHGVRVEETREKLSYDLYYVKNRSVVLDCIIVLKTIKTLLSRKGK